MITTDNAEYAQRMKQFRNHCITTDHRQRAEQGSWFYEMVDLGYNYRLTDIQCALGRSQLKKLPARTRDGHRVNVLVNVDLQDEVGSVKDYGAAGIGL